MDADQIVKLTPDVVRELVESERVNAVPKHAPGCRKEERWPFPGTIEVWLPDQCYGERHMLATLHNLSLHGLGMRTRRPVPVDTRVLLAVHQPEMSCYGHAVVRHCTQAHAGYLIGMEFIFENQATKED